MNKLTLAGDELARHVDALDRKIDTLSSQLRSLLEQAPRGPSAPISPKPITTAPPTTPRAPPTNRTTAPREATVRATDERIEDGSRPVPNAEGVARTRRREGAQRRLEEGRRSRLAVAGLSESPPRPTIARGSNPMATAKSSIAVVARSIHPKTATAPPDVARSSTRSRCTLSIPDDAAGHIIGRDGHGLRLATEFSGARISVAKSTPESSSPRIATIHGTSEQIGKALVALGKRIGQQRVPNPRRERPTRIARVTGRTEPQPRIANPSPTS